ncbi:TonB family protein [Mitsuokella jalaludinii]|uniref:energy transducer TonB n=1 Tax=Mitsuokella jalaludinii TaxID=187979 RepID=UPI003F954375
MLREDKENAAGWGISCGVHIIILMIVAATGLFQAVSSESHPVDVEIYDNVTEDEQPSDDNSEAEAAPAESEPDASQPDPIVVDQSVAVPAIETEQKDEKEQTEKKQENASDRAAKNPAADAKPNAKGSPNGKPGGDADKPKAGPAHDPAHVKHVKVHAQQLSTSQPAYPVSLQAKKAVGTVTVNYIINASGGVESPQIEASSGYPEMDAAALAAIVNFTYSPARNDYDEPVNTHGRYTFRFHP